MVLEIVDGYGPSGRAVRFDVTHHLGSTPVLGILSVGVRGETGGDMTMISRRGFDCVGLAQGEDGNLGSYAQPSSADPAKSPVNVQPRALDFIHACVKTSAP